MGTFLHFCGVDVGKTNLDYYHTSSPKGLTGQLANQLSAIEAEFCLPKYDDTLFVLEHTGSYSSKLIHQLHRLGRPTSVVGPHKSKFFMSALGITNKNDKQAAQSLSLMGQKIPLPLYRIPSDSMRKRKQVLNTVAALQKQERMLKNQIHALEQLPLIDEGVATAYNNILKSVQNEIQPLQEKLRQTTTDAEFEEMKKYVTSVKGIGEKTAQALLLATNNFKTFDSAAKAAKFLGLTPSSHYSGSSVRIKGKITKFGNNHVRSLLFNCTRSAIRFNKPCKELFERLRKQGKPYKVAAIAVMHKLVKQAFACAKQKVIFDNEYHVKYK